MKKILLLGVLSSFTLLSCSNDEEFSRIDEAGELKTKSIVGKQGFEVIDLNGEPCIRFDNDSVFMAVLEEMSNSSQRIWKG